AENATRAIWNVAERGLELRRIEQRMKRDLRVCGAVVAVEAGIDEDGVLADFVDAVARVGLVELHEARESIIGMPEASRQHGKRRDRRAAGQPPRPASGRRRRLA